MYYLAESGAMLDDFKGLSVMGRKERDRLVVGMGKEYVFGGLGTASGIGVQYCIPPPTKAEERVRNTCV